jgi:hypothetical protein
MQNAECSMGIWIGFQHGGLMKSEMFGNEEVIRQLPLSLRRFLNFERYHLHKADHFLDPSADTDFDARYFPGKCGAFKLPCYWIPREYLHVYGDQIEDEELSVVSDCGEKILFAIHPTATKHYGEFLRTARAQDVEEIRGQRVWAVPTSSTRTLLAWPDQCPQEAVFIKTSLHSPVLGDRRLQIADVARCVGLSLMLEAERKELPAFDYFAERVGVVPRAMQDSGMIVRSIPKDIRADRITAAPFYSLLGEGRGEPPLFLTLLRETGMEAEEVVEEILCAPFIRLWLELGLRFGVTLEAHGQNLLMGLPKNLSQVHRLMYRDFSGIQVDWELRAGLGLSCPASMPQAWRWHSAYGAWGTRYGQLSWYKLGISLYDYVGFFLLELQSSLMEWQKLGLISGRVFNEHDVTTMFSRQMRKAADQMFGFRMAEGYDICRSRSRFLIELLMLRKQLMAERPRMKRFY